MHIPENYLSPTTCVLMATAMLPVWAHAVKKVNEELPREKIPMLGVGAAYSFLGMMFNVPLVGGTTGHAVGGTLIAMLFGPNAACIAVSIALLLQALIFGDGGVLAFGANCFNMAFVLPYAGYGIYKLIMKFVAKRHEKGLDLAGQKSSLNLSQKSSLNLSQKSSLNLSQKSGLDADKKSVSRKVEYLAAGIGSYIAINLAAFCAAVEFGIQPLLFKDSLGNAIYCPYDLSVSIPAMMIPHLLVAGLVEAAFTVAVYAFVCKTSPDLTFSKIDLAKKSKKSYIPVYALVAVLIAASPLGLLASGTAWGEWGADEIAETSYAGSSLNYTPSGLENGWSLESLMPDYTLGSLNEAFAYILSAIIGVSILIIAFKLFAIPMKGKKNYDS